ncbi:methionine synthase [Actinospica acidithermotolerans]|nr:methionine synthase [Actinospica acidithermotolerans]
MPAAIRLVFDGLGGAPGVPYLPELPARGVGADLAGRGLALLVDLVAEVAPSGWRVADRPGRDHARALSHLRRDLDQLEEHTQGYEGPLKVQAVGPWTLAATVELKHGDKLLADPGACRELAESLSEGVAEHLAELRRRVPGARLVLQLDEPALPGVLRGSVPTASGFGKLRAVEEPVVRDTLRRLVETIGESAPERVPVVFHCCAPDVPFATFRGAGAAAVALDWSLLTTRQDETVAELVEAGVGLYAGVVPSLDPAAKVPLRYQDVVDSVLALRRVGLSARQLAEAVTVTPACGLAGASPQWAGRAQRLCLDAARALADVD